MAAPNEITVQQLSHLIGLPDCPQIIDVCIDEDFALDPRIIPGSRRHPFTKIEELAPELHGKKVVVICHKGLKLSQGAAALLRLNGVAAQTLAGGIVAWAAAGLPMVKTAKVTSSLWVTRHRPKIDRIACPWLIRRFVDPSARFMFVSPSQVLNVAEKFKATPFDVEDCYWSHRDEFCTFDIMVKEFGIAHNALETLAKIVRGADTDRLDISPQSAGLMAASLGLSRMYKDDLEQLEAGIALYDAFYRWARDAQDENHTWITSGSPK